MTPIGDPRLVWYSNQFNEEERFAAYRDMTKRGRRSLIGTHGSPGPTTRRTTAGLYYGPIYQWVDIFKHRA